MRQAVGPQKVEYDAATFVGNSGSPIILTSTQNVIGIVTYESTIDLSNIFSSDAIRRSDSPISSSLRRFGTRFDSIKNWESIVLSDWLNQDKQIYKYYQRLASFRSLVSNSGVSFNHDSLMNTPELWSACEKYELDVAQKGITQIDIDNAVKRILFTIDALTNPDSGKYLAEIRKSEKEYYSFYRNDLESLENEQIKCNELWLKNKTDILHNIAVNNKRGN